MIRALYILPLLALLVAVALPQPAHAAAKKVFLTAGTQWLVPDDWVSEGSSIEVIGGGAGATQHQVVVGFDEQSDTVADIAPSDLVAASGDILADSNGGPGGPPSNGGGSDGTGECTGNCGNGTGGGGGGGQERLYNYGGGGGAYSKITNLTLTPGTTVGYHIGLGGKSAVNGGPTWLCNSTLGCGGPAGASVKVAAFGAIGYVGGLASKGIGSLKHSGGHGIGLSSPYYGPGGGAGGPLRNGGNGRYVRAGDGSMFKGGVGGGGQAGAGGAGRQGKGKLYGGGGAGVAAGAPGIIVITYNALSSGVTGCTITLNPTAVAKGESAQISWSSENADSFYIDNGVGPQNENVEGGPSWLPPATQTTTYTGTVTKAGQNPVYCSATLVVDETPAPTVTTQPVTNKSSISATLNGTANPQGSATRAWFRYSTTNPGTCNDTFGARIPVPPGVNLGTDTIEHNYSQILSGLTRDETYYYCAIAENAGGKGFGIVRSFSTSDAPCTNPLPGYSCVGDELWYTDGACVVTKTVCAPPTSCTLDPEPACVYNPIAPSLTVIPDKVQYGHTTTVSWNYPAAESCTITGSNGDYWHSLEGSEQSTGIVQRTTYTAVCDDTDADTIEDDFTESAVVTLLPLYREI